LGRRLYRIAADDWPEVWPQDAGYWENKAVQIGQDRWLVYQVEIELEGEDRLIPNYHYRLTEELIWDPAAEAFN